MRPHTDAPLIHNYMGRELNFDHFELAHDLDIASWDSYGPEPVTWNGITIAAAGVHWEVL